MTMKRLAEVLGEFELTADDVAALLQKRGVTFEIERGIIRFWQDGVKVELPPVRHQPYLFTEYPIYDLLKIEQVLTEVR
jgi:hypothetical protein